MTEVLLFRLVKISVKRVGCFYDIHPGKGMTLIYYLYTHEM